MIKYLYDLDKVAIEKDGSDTTQATYTHEGGSLYEDLISMKRGGSSYYYLFDGLGSTRGLVDANENTTDTYSYEGFGNVTSSSGTTTNYYKYVGAYDVEWDANPAFYFMEARYYAANIGRFTTGEALVTFPHRPPSPASLHRYAYCLNNPVNSIDPSGRHGYWGCYIVCMLAHSWVATIQVTYICGPFVKCPPLAAICLLVVGGIVGYGWSDFCSDVAFEHSFGYPCDYVQKLTERARNETLERAGFVCPCI